MNRYKRLEAHVIISDDISIYRIDYDRLVDRLIHMEMRPLKEEVCIEEDNPRWSCLVKFSKGKISIDGVIKHYTTEGRTCLELFELLENFKVFQVPRNSIKEM